MKKVVFLFTILFFTHGRINAQEKVISLYEGLAPGSENWGWAEAENNANAWQTKVVYNVSKPTLTVFTPDSATANGTAIVICPGGSFHALSINSEGIDVAKWLVKKGITCFVLKYRLAHSVTTDPVAEIYANWGKKEFTEANGAIAPLAIADGKAAIKWVRKHASEYGINGHRIGIIGFSSGGTVACGTIFNYTKENRPDFAAPIYTYFPSTLHGTVAADAPPIFILAATDDALNLVQHSIDLYNKWIGSKKSAELHLYSKGGHGFGMRQQKLPSDTWLERFSDWLNVQGLLQKTPINTAFILYQKRAFEFAQNQTLPYRILYPENYDASKKYPLLLFLHGAGERGNDNEKQLTHGAKLFLDAQNRQKFPAIVVFPQCPEASSWSPMNAIKKDSIYILNFNYTPPANWPLTAANELIKKIIKEEAVNPAKVYIGGLSMGGMGTFESVYRYPGMYAAALPICGGGDAVKYNKPVAKTAFWVFHGASDNVVNVVLSQQMVHKLKQLKAEVKYSEYPGVYHDSWDTAFAEPNFLTWIMAHQLKK